MKRNEALGILGLDTAEAKDFAAVRTAYHRRMRAVHPDLNPSPDASEAASMVSAAYDLLERAYRTQKNARMLRDAASHRSAGHSQARHRRGIGARVISDTTITAMGRPSEIFALARSAGERIGMVTGVDATAGMVVVTAEFVHTPPCQVTLRVAGRGEDRTHVRCSVETLSAGDAPPIAAVTRLVAQQLVAAGQEPTGAVTDRRVASGN